MVISAVYLIPLSFFKVISADAAPFLTATAPETLSVSAASGLAKVSLSTSVNSLASLTSLAIPLYACLFPSTASVARSPATASLICVNDSPTISADASIIAISADPLTAFEFPAAASLTNLLSNNSNLSSFGKSIPKSSAELSKISSTAWSNEIPWSAATSTAAVDKGEIIVYLEFPFILPTYASPVTTSTPPSASISPAGLDVNVKSPLESVVTVSPVATSVTVAPEIAPSDTLPV